MKLGTPWFACLVTALLVGPAVAQYGSDYEDFTASPDGTPLTGQGGYVLPAPETSVDFLVYSYLGNPLGIPANPYGGQKFVGGTGPAGGFYARAQLTPDPGMYGDASGQWTVSYDIAAAFTGVRPTAQNLGSFSLQPEANPLAPTSTGFVALAQWTDPATAVAWNANYIAYDAAGNYIYPAVVPDAAFQNLDIEHWYRWSTTFDFDTNRIIEVSLMDLVTGDTATVELEDWYLGGGAAGGLAAPTGFRYFAGGGVAGNTLAFDNVSVIPEPAGLTTLAALGLLVLRRR